MRGAMLTRLETFRFNPCILASITRSRSWLGSVALRPGIDGLACRLPAVARHQAPPFQHLPAEKARHSEHEVGGALDERQRNRLFRWNSECRAQHDERAFLRAERTGD